MNGGSHAVMWTGTAKSQVGLHSGPFSSSEATGVNGQVQVAWGSNIVDVITQNAQTWKWQLRHATMWNSTPGSIKDMNPPGYLESAFTAIGQLNASGVMVGWVRPGVQTKVDPIPITVPLVNHAAVWTAGKFTDLHQFLPAAFDGSMALGVDPITGVIVGAAWNTRVSNSLVPITWTRQ
jgi:hypothetical protein